MIIVTGGSGFIGKNFIFNWFHHSDEPLLNIDNLTYAASEDVLTRANFGSKYTFVKQDIANSDRLFEIFDAVNPRCVINFAAETHVDRSIVAPENFITTNILGTSKLLEAIRAYHFKLSATEKKEFKFIHISTDEVFGSLRINEAAFSESCQFKPNNPYSASKASAAHLVRAYRKTYGIDSITVNCSNNYGPFQFPEKLIPLCISNALKGESLPVYGDGKQIRDWLFVDDHCSAIRLLIENKNLSSSYNVSGQNERQNIVLVKQICGLLDLKRPRSDGASYSSLIKFTEDRAGHDLRYAVNSNKIHREIGWKPLHSFDEGLEKTVDWYLNNKVWLDLINARSC